MPTHAHKKMKVVALNSHSPEASHDRPLVFTCCEGRIRYASPSALHLLDARISAGASWPALWPAETARVIRSALQVLAAGDTPRPIDVTLAAGQRCQLRALPIVDEGSTIGVIWQFEAALSSLMAARYELAFEKSAIAQWYVDLKPIHAFLQHEGVLQFDAVVQRAETDRGFVEEIRRRLDFLAVNEAAAQLAGADSAQHLREHFREVLRPEDVLFAALAATVVSDQPVMRSHQTEFPVFGGGTRELQVDYYVPALANLDIGMLVSARDMTPLKNAQAEIAEREHFLGTILHTVPDYLFVFDFERGEPIFTNGDIGKQLGYNDGELELLGQNLFAYIVHPDDKLRDDSFESLKDILSRRRVFENTMRLQHANGEWRHFVFRSAGLNVDDDGKIRYAVIVARDVTDVLKAERGLSEQQRLYRQLAENFSDVMITTGTDLKPNYVSPSARTVLGYAPDMLMELPSSELLNLLGLNDIADELQQAMQRAMSRRRRGKRVPKYFQRIVECDARRADLSAVPLEVKVSILHDEHMLVEGLMLLCRDISERKRVETNLRLAAKVFENSLEGIYITDAGGTITQVNKAFCAITGYTEDEAIGRRPSFLSSGWHDLHFRTDIQPVLHDSGYWAGELVSRRKGGEAFPSWVGITEVRADDGEFVGYITTFRDITEAKNSEQRIRKLAYFDPLTDLPNRSLFHDRLTQALQRAVRSSHSVAVLFLDLDRFKAINDSMGHAVGDRLLTEAAARLRDCIRADDTVARMGGDEFTLILGGLTGREAAESAAVQVALKIMRSLNEPFMLSGRELFISTSIGIALYPEDGTNAETLLKNADTAMYHAKAAGKNGYQFYTEVMNARSLERLELQQRLYHAVQTDELRLLYQPIVNFRTRKLVGLEALLRWQHPDLGLLEPAHFMQFAEEAGIAARIGRWVINAACQQFSSWRAMGLRAGRIAVNISAQHYRDGELINDVIAALDGSNMLASQLELEFTEGALMADFGYSLSLQQDLKALGVRLSVDDFGTGYCSLNYLKQLPVDCLKIDRSFIAHIEAAEDERRIAHAVIGLARSFGLDIVAEGVETDGQIRQLMDMGCDEGQGYVVGKPLDARNMLKWLKHYRLHQQVAMAGDDIG